MFTLYSSVLLVIYLYGVEGNLLLLWLLLIFDSSPSPTPSNIRSKYIISFRGRVTLSRFTKQKKTHRRLDSEGVRVWARRPCGLWIFSHLTRPTLGK